MKKILSLLFVLFLVVACATNETETQEYDVVEVSASELEKVDTSDLSKYGKVFFATNKYNIEKKYENVLKAQVAVLKKADKDVKFVVAGYCDARGSSQYNLALGKRRANSVKNYLVKKGISANRIETISYGKDSPIVNGSGEGVWSQNRVVITTIK